MSYFFERIQTEGIAGLSYLIGDSSTRVAAVIDPRADVEIYLELARKHQVAIGHVLETHIHADFVSGARELAGRCGIDAVRASTEGGQASYGYPVEPIRDGERIDLDSVVITARHTPGHTPEHMSFEIAESVRADQPFAVYSGDSLFVNSAGRPDLLGDGARELASQLHETLFGYYAKLDPGVIVYPSHGAGSPCGASIGERLESTIGYELKWNPFYQHEDREDFIDHALSSAPPEPTYYKRMKKVNESGPEVSGCLPVVPALSPAEFSRRAPDADGAVLIDTRHMLAFGGGHIPGALNIGASPMLTVWAGWLLDPAEEIYLVLEDDKRIEEVVALLVRSGYTKFGGYLAGGIKAWENEGLDLVDTPQVPVRELKQQRGDLQLLDVRTPEEWGGGHMPGALHIFLPEIGERTDEIDRDRPVATYCASGYRASIAASWLQSLGFDARNVPGSWQAWMNAGFEVEKEAA